MWRHNNTTSHRDRERERMRATLSQTDKPCWVHYSLMADTYKIWNTRNSIVLQSRLHAPFLLNSGYKYNRTAHLTWKPSDVDFFSWPVTEMNGMGLSLSEICCLFCCPPCPSKIAAKLAFLPPETTYSYEVSFMVIRLLDHELFTVLFRTLSCFVLSY